MASNQEMAVGTPYPHPTLPGSSYHSSPKLPLSAGVHHGIDWPLPKSSQLLAAGLAGGIPGQWQGNDFMWMPCQSRKSKWPWRRETTVSIATSSEGTDENLKIHSNSFWIRGFRMTCMSSITQFLDRHWCSQRPDVFRQVQKVPAESTLRSIHALVTDLLKPGN